MGLLDDLKMGLGLKKRDKGYYERTAKTLGRMHGEDRARTYRQSSSYGKPERAGLLSFMGGRSGGGSSSRSDREPSRGFLPTLLGYRDMEDMFDRGGPYASGGMYQGAGGYSLLANLAHAASGKEFGERTPYEKIEAQAVIKSTDGAVPEATRNAIASLRPMLRPDNLNVPGEAMPTQIGNSGMGMEVPMNTPQQALDTLYGRQVAHRSEGRGAFMPGYDAEKRLIQMPEFAAETDLSETQYASLMPPQPSVPEVPMGNQITPTGDTAYSAILQRLNDPNTSPVEYSYLMAQKQMMETGQYPVGY